MSFMVKIRKANQGDADSIYQLVCLLTEKKMDAEVFRSKYSLHLKSDKIFYWVLASEGSVLGFISMHIQELLHHDRCVAEVQELCIDEKYRSLGFGKILLEQAIEEAKKLNCELIELAASKKRDGAHRFYEREGWERSHFKFTRKL